MHSDAASLAGTRKSYQKFFLARACAIRVDSPPLAYFQRAFAALLAISFRLLADMPSARAFPPLRPSATAAGSLPSNSATGP